MLEGWGLRWPLTRPEEGLLRSKLKNLHQDQKQNNHNRELEFRLNPLTGPGIKDVMVIPSLEAFPKLFIPPALQQRW